jgi:phenylalanine-4-hydroxylase
MTDKSDYTYGNPEGDGRAEDYLSYIIPQKQYTAEEDGTWNILFERMSEIVKDRACEEQLEGLKALGIGANGVPKYDDINKKLKELTGWEVVAVPGLIPNLPFFKLLSERKFPSGNFIRTREQLDYIEEPDVFHDVFGHVPLLANPVFADYLQAYGAGGMRAHGFDTVTNLSRLYWFTVEFGLINTPKGLRIYGAGIISSPGETVFSLEDPSPNRIGFDLERVMQTAYRVDDYQQTYFVIDSFEDLFRQTYADFEPIYNRLKSEGKTYTPAETIASDRLITKGTQAYAKSKGKAA